LSAFTVRPHTQVQISDFVAGQHRFMITASTSPVQKQQVSHQQLVMYAKSRHVTQVILLNGTQCHQYIP